MKHDDDIARGALDELAPGVLTSLMDHDEAVQRHPVGGRSVTGRGRERSERSSSADAGARSLSGCAAGRLVARREIGGTSHQGKSTRVRLAKESFNALGVRKDVREAGQSDEGRVGRDQCVSLCVQGCRRQDGVEGADFLN